MSIAANLSIIREKIERAAQRSGRSGADVTLLAVTKTVPVERIEEAIAAGVTHLGENRVQEALEKYSYRGAPEAGKVDREGITLHMIGTLQRNKARRAAACFDWVQSLDRVELAHDLDKASPGAKRRAPARADRGEPDGRSEQIGDSKGRGARAGRRAGEIAPT